MLPKRLISNYEVVEEFAEGGQSFTFLAQKEKRKYIIKIPKSTNLSREKKFRLEREIRALELMDGNGVPKLIDFSIEEEVFIVMEYIDGLTLDKYIQNVNSTFENVIKISEEICTIIENAHKIGLYHRDLKPDNIIISLKENIPIIIDFGICWLKDDTSFKTNKNIELGNRFLRLPELSKGTDITVSTSDITFIVGILFYLITKKQPYQLLNEHGEMPHQRKEFDNFEFKSNKQLIQIFDKGFSFEIHLRYQTAKELKIDLEKLSYPEITNIESMKVNEILDDIFKDTLFLKKESSIEKIKEAHKLFLKKFREELHNKLTRAGNVANYVENKKAVETRMCILQKGTSDPTVNFFLESKFNASFDQIYLKFGTENYSDENNHTIREETKIISLYPEIAKTLCEQSMLELSSKIRQSMS